MTVKLEGAGIDRFKSVSEIANMSPVYCGENSTIAEVAEKMVKSGYRRMPILSGSHKLVGILTTSDILDAFLKKENFHENISVIMIRDVVFCEFDDTIDFVLQKFKLSRRGGFPIMKDSTLAGIISERDIVKRFADVSFSMTVGERMTRKPLFISPHMSIFDCLKSIVNTKYRRLPVVENGKLVGITTVADLLKYIYENGFRESSMDEDMDAVVTKDVCTIGKEKDLSDAIRLMKSRDVGGILVVDDGRLEGIITERDILEEVV